MGINKYVLLFCFSVLVLFINAQDRQWLSFSNADKTTSLAEEKRYLWVGTTAGLARLDKATGNRLFFDKSNSGLPCNAILSLAIDGDGVKWIGTDGGGIVKYDGSTWTVYNTANSGVSADIITSVFIDADGNKWIGTHGGGMVKLDQRQQWSAYTKANSRIPSNNVQQVLEYNNKVWLATQNGLAQFSDGVFISFSKSNSPLLSDNVKCLAVGSNGDLWIGLNAEYGSTRSGLVWYDGNNWKVYNTTNSALPVDEINAIALDSDNSVLLGTGANDYSTLIRFDGVNWTYSEFAEDGISAVLVDREGKTWIATEEGGIKKLSDGSVMNYEISNSGIPANNVSAIDIDESQTKWIVLSDGRVVSYDGDNWISLTRKTNLFEAYSAIEVDGNGLKWIAGDVLASFSGSAWQQYIPREDEMPFFYATCMQTDQDGVKWIGTEAGLVKFDGSTWEVFSMPGNNIVRCIALDKEGNKWVGTDDGGLVRFSEDVSYIYNTSNSGIGGNKITSVAIDEEGNKWIAAFMNGLCSFDGYSWIVFDTINSGLPDAHIRDIAIDHKGIKWLATTNGLVKFDGNSWKFYNTSNSPLADNFVLSVTIDADNNKWLCLPLAGLNVFNEEGVKLETKKSKPVAVANTVSVFPNPSGGKFQVVVSDEKAARNAKVNVYDVLGNTVYRSVNGTKSVFNIDLSAYPRGIYFVEVDTGREKVNRKIIVN